MKLKVRIDLYNHCVFFYIGESELENFATAAKLTDEETAWLKDPDVGGMATGNIVFIKRHKSINVVTHEISHAVCDVIETHNLPEDSEVRAYLMGYILEQYFSGYTSMKKDMS